MLHVISSLSENVEKSPTVLTKTYASQVSLIFACSSKLSEKNTENLKIVHIHWSLKNDNNLACSQLDKDTTGSSDFRKRQSDKMTSENLKDAGCPSKSV